MVRVYRNISFATAESFDEVLRNGSVVTVRGSETKELRNRVTPIARPLERCVFLPGRRNDVFAQIAETFWVIGGRNDLQWLARYLPRAPEFSDDGGITWHGAYGPRLRAWAGRVDQLDEWRRLLNADPMSRRAVGVLFDPDRDFVPASNDIPCNNWLSWLLRDGCLHLNVAIRSNDAMWGFSGVNAFEWSILQEMMAFWTNAEVGEATFFATSYHIYSRHYGRARDIVGRFYGLSPYDFGISSSRFSTSWENFSAAMINWFELEEQLRDDPDSVPDEGLATRDPLLASTLQLLRLKWGSERWTERRLMDELSALPEDDFATAAYEYFGRSQPKLLTNIRQPKIAAFFQACQTAKGDDANGLRVAIKHLHERKNAGYASSWKRRGERVSVLPNIARKVDRLQAFAEKEMIIAGEAIFDTAVDLYVYTTKYCLFLAEFPGADVSRLDAQAPKPFSDHDENFNSLVDVADFTADVRGNFVDEVGGITLTFENLWRAADAGDVMVDRQRLATELAVAAARLVGLLVAIDKPSVSEFIRHESEFQYP